MLCVRIQITLHIHFQPCAHMKSLRSTRIYRHHHNMKYHQDMCCNMPSWSSYPPQSVPTYLLDIHPDLQQVIQYKIHPGSTMQMMIL
mmetsp:Transcript_86405/g.126447  ORF Transcript_86405/g.126447 Transcript_86405/m.126447 type:complete len:87 (-) Transcript_86405:1147-1407(-)